jgi:sulfite exporter TauE/SafE
MDKALFLLFAAVVGAIAAALGAVISAVADLPTVRTMLEAYIALWAGIGINSSWDAARLTALGAAIGDDVELFDDEDEDEEAAA